MADRVRQQRLQLSDEDEAALRHLYGQVPTETKVYRDWTTEQGRAFIAAAKGIRDAGVPVRWMAERLGIDDRILLQIIEKSHARDGAERRGPVRRRLPGRGRPQGDAP